MTISAQCLNPTEKNKFKKLRRSLKTNKQTEEMNKQLSKILQDAINGAGTAESANIKMRIALALRRTFPLG